MGGGAVSLKTFRRKATFTRSHLQLLHLALQLLGHTFFIILLSSLTRYPPSQVIRCNQGHFQRWNHLSPASPLQTWKELETYAKGTTRLTTRRYFLSSCLYLPFPRRRGHSGNSSRTISTAHFYTPRCNSKVLILKTLPVSVEAKTREACWDCLLIHLNHRSVRIGPCGSLSENLARFSANKISIAFGPSPVWSTSKNTWGKECPNK